MGGAISGGKEGESGYFRLSPEQFSRPEASTDYIITVRPFSPPDHPSRDRIS